MNPFSGLITHLPLQEHPQLSPPPAFFLEDAAMRPTLQDDARAGAFPLRRASPQSDSNQSKATQSPSCVAMTGQPTTESSGNMQPQAFPWKREELGSGFAHENNERLRAASANDWSLPPRPVVRSASGSGFGLPPSSLSSSSRKYVGARPSSPLLSVNEDVVPTARALSDSSQDSVLLPPPSLSVHSPSRPAPSFVPPLGGYSSHITMNMNVNITTNSNQHDSRSPSPPSSALSTSSSASSSGASAMFDPLPSISSAINSSSNQPPQYHHHHGLPPMSHAVRKRKSSKKMAREKDNNEHTAAAVAGAAAMVAAAAAVSSVSSSSQAVQSSSSSSSSSKSPFEKLNTLKLLLDCGHLTQEEYQERKTQIINEMTGTSTERKKSVVAPRRTLQPIMKTVVPHHPPDFNRLMAERAEKLSFDVDTLEWNSSSTRVKLDLVPFSTGELRNAYYLQDLGEASSSNTPPRLLVAKFSQRQADPGSYLSDVEMQAVCAHYAALYNEHEPPLKVYYARSWLLKLRDRNDLVCSVEEYLQGSYVKYSNNNGYVGKETSTTEERERNTPQSFSHFSFVASDYRLMIVDIQGVNDQYTDPQIHSADGRGFGAGNLGTFGMEKFLESHRCNEVCRWLGLQSIHGQYKVGGTAAPAYEMPFGAAIKKSTNRITEERNTFSTSVTVSQAFGESWKSSSEGDLAAAAACDGRNKGQDSVSTLEPTHPATGSSSLLYQQQQQLLMNTTSSIPRKGSRRLPKNNSSDSSGGGPILAWWQIFQRLLCCCFSV